jgi:hypothetical protein
MHSILFATLLLGLAGCASADPRERVPARLVLLDETAEVHAPESVRRGEPFTVTVVTIAGGCRRESAGTGVAVEGMEATITPYHFLRRAEACTDDLLYLPHEVELRFDEPGTATLRIRGVRNRLDFEREPEWVTLERSVEVR